MASRSLRGIGRYNDGCYSNFRLMSETLGTNAPDPLVRTPTDRAQRAVRTGNGSQLHVHRARASGATDRGDSDEFVVHRAIT